MNGDAFCGATVISKRFVLTTVDCVGADDGFQIGISDLHIGATKYRAKSYSVHPGYDAFTLANDIAIYELETDLPDSFPYVRLESNAVTVEGTPMTIMGFGTTEEGILSDKLKVATVGYVQSAECNTLFREEHGEVNAILPSMLCASGNGNGADTCTGDGGGPLILHGNSASEDTLVGITSWGYGCADTTPGVYTRIFWVYDWIVETMCAMNPAGVPDYVTCGTQSSGDVEEMPPGTQSEANRWIPPRFGDQRSPCPFLNAMANHGFINRNGTNIDINDMADKLEEVYNVKASFLHAGPIHLMIECDQTYTDENGVERFDLDVLFDGNCEEHEASFVRADSHFGFQASKHVDDTLLNNLMRRNPGESILTFENILDYQAERITNSRLTNPETEFRLFDIDNMGAQAMFLFLLSTDETMMTIEKERLYSFLLNEKLPDGFLSESLRDTPFDPSDPSDFTHERIMLTKKNVEDMLNKRLGQ